MHAANGRVYSMNLGIIVSAGVAGGRRSYGVGSTTWHEQKQGESMPWLSTTAPFPFQSGASNDSHFNKNNDGGIVPSASADCSLFGSEATPCWAFGAPCSILALGSDWIREPTCNVEAIHSCISCNRLDCQDVNGCLQILSTSRVSRHRYYSRRRCPCSSKACLSWLHWQQNAPCDASCSVI